MKKLFTLLFWSSLVFFQSNCTKKAIDENSNQSNVNTAVVVQTNQVNANVKPADTPLPTFTNADEALTEGKKLLDDLEKEKAIDALTQATKLNPDLAEAHFNLGIAYALTEKDEDETALTQVEATPTPKTTRKSKKNAPAPRTKNSEKAFDNAVKAYKKILAKNPKDDVSQFNLGRAYNKLNEDEDAAKALKQAVKLQPEDGEYQTELGAILIKLAQYDEAVAALKKAVNLDESNLQAADLLEKAQAGKKRVDFGNKPNSPPPQKPEQTRRRGTSPTPGKPDAPKESDDAPKNQPKDQPKELPKPARPNANKSN
ncbi:MAG: tetratricopeptide repeat protein [Acidobacteriota bacterium]|nr:tetratricopeptide repeat protein [Acidobacteriota bacterium]